MDDASLAYLPRNVAPEVLSISSLPIGVGLQQIAQLQIDPNVESSGLDPSLFGAAAQCSLDEFSTRCTFISMAGRRSKRRSMEYAIYYRPLNETTFRLLKDKLRDNFYTIDGATLADGRYIVKIIASDAPDNPLGSRFSGERVSDQ